MTDQNDARVEVIQADRVAAWPHRPAWYHAGAEEDWLNGIYDSADVIQHFARHRIASAATARAEVVEECARVADAVPIKSRDSRDAGCEAAMQIDIVDAIRNLAPPSSRGWQPIETAPRDDTLILVWRKTDYSDDPQVVVRWENDWWQVHDGKSDFALRGPEPTPKLAATLNKSPDNFKAGAEVSSFVQSDAAVIERAASEAIVLIDEINKHAPSRRFNGINQPLHCKLATIRATLARALRPVLDAREGG